MWQGDDDLKKKFSPRSRVVAPVAIHGVLRDEYERVGRMIQVHQAEIEKLPKGSVREKKYQGRTYHYLHFRNQDGKVKDVFIKGGEQGVAEIRDQVAQRKQRVASFKQLRSEQKAIERMLKKK